MAVAVAVAVGRAPSGVGDRLPPVDHIDAERGFYLEHFRGHSLLVAQRGPGEGVVPVVEHLVRDGATVLRLHDGRAEPADERWPAGASLAGGLDLPGRWWATLRHGRRLDVAVPAGEDAWAVGAHLATRLRPFKLVLVDPAAPHEDDQPPFVTLGQMDEGEARPGQALAATVLAAGVGSVNVCRPEDLATELLTYRGAGVVYTREAYCTVDRLRLDDFDAAHRLIDRGVAEGYLLPRPVGEVVRLLLEGYGARFGDAHLAGVAALVRYPGSGMAEVSSLTTISRFTGGGVGSTLVRRMLTDAATEGLEAVFACTTSAEAERFFLGLGFARVGHDDVPPAKWEGYDTARRTQLIALRHDLTPARL